MYPIQIADQTFIAAQPVIVADYLHIYDWEKLWPGFHLQVTEDRNLLGIRWKVTVPIYGTMEIWLQEHLDGVLLHYFVHAQLCEQENFIPDRSVQSQFHSRWQKLYRTCRLILRNPVRLASEQDFVYHLHSVWWDQDSVRKHSRKIVQRIKRAAETGRCAGDPAQLSERQIVH